MLYRAAIAMKSKYIRHREICCNCVHFDVNGEGTLERIRSKSGIVVNRLFAPCEMNDDIMSSHNQCNCDAFQSFTTDMEEFAESLGR